MGVTRLLALLLVLLLFIGCGGPAASPPSAAGRVPSSYTAATAEARPGLGTRWGETRLSRARDVRFRRAEGRPLAVTAVYYNDARGIAAMSAGASLRRTWPILPGPAGALVSVGLRDAGGALLPGTLLGNRWFAPASKAAVTPSACGTAPTIASRWCSPSTGWT
ncbi:hypothetical protein BH20VER1_BH20VER1_09620 [soil metagenome]